MRKALIRIGFCTLVVLACSGAASADSVSYVITSTYGGSLPSTNSSGVIAPNTGFTFTFSEPFPLTSFSGSTSSELDTVTTVTYTSGAFTTMGMADVDFFPMTSDPDSGLLDINFLSNLGSDSYLWEFFGGQLYTGTTTPVLSFGTFPIDPSVVCVDGPCQSDNFGGGNVVATFVPSGVPEPALLPLLATGLFGLIGLRRRLSC